MAELELLLGQVKGSKANIEPIAALELLQVACLSLPGSHAVYAACISGRHLQDSSAVAAASWKYRGCLGFQDAAYYDTEVGRAIL